ncbi:MAG: nitroreductase family protein [Bacteroidales bacterium]|nr:nitroreductase family protein [Bacteroidales bacterium]
MEFGEVIRKRYSCREFSGEMPSPEIVSRILEAGRIAPTAVNRQPVHIWAVSDPLVLEKIKSVTRSNFGAPLILVVGCRPDSAWVRKYDGKNGAMVDASIVSTYLMLAAENEGLSTLWVGSFDPAALADILPGTEGYEMVSMINAGYPAGTCVPSPMHSVRKGIDELVTKL